MKARIKQYLILFLTLTVSLTFSACNKDLNLETEVVLVEKELVIEYEVISAGDHLITLFKNESDLLADQDMLYFQSKNINTNAGVVAFNFEGIDTDEIFVKLRIVTINGSVDKLLQYERSIQFPDFNLILHRKINNSEWIEI